MTDRYSYSCYSCFFEGVSFLIFIYNYLYINYLYRFKERVHTSFFNCNNCNCNILSRITHSHFFYKAFAFL